MRRELKILECETGFILEKEEYCETGFILEKEEYCETEDKEVPWKEVIEGHCENHDGIDELLKKVAEHFGVEEDRFKNTNLRISWDREGSKYCK